MCPHVNFRRKAQEGERYGKRRVHNTCQYLAYILSKLDFWPSKAHNDQLEELLPRPLVGFRT